MTFKYFKTLNKVLLGAVLGVATTLGLNTTANAASISLQLVDSDPVIQGDIFALNIFMDFTDDPTIGGGFDILYDPTLVSYIGGSFLVEETLFSDPFFTRDDNPLSPASNRVDIDTTQGEIVGAAFGDFIGLTGPSLVGTLSFQAEQAGLASFGLQTTINPLVGDFISAFTNQPQPVDFFGASVAISEVPVPAAGWLLLSAFAGLAGFARRQ